MKKLAIGYQQPQNGENFSDIVEDYLDTIAEVYFAWPGESGGRWHACLDPQTEQNVLVSELENIREHHVKLDLLLNGNCYGGDAISVHFQTKINAILEYLDANGVLPEIVTTTSPFVAGIIRKSRPQIELRASVNMRIDSTLAMEYLGDLFDSFYIRRDIQRDVKTVAAFSLWCCDHHKKLCMLVNSGCLRNCPYQTFHDNLVSHASEVTRTKNVNDFPSHLCWERYQNQDAYVDFLRSSWIRPEDLHVYEPYISVFKLATRVHMRPRIIVDAYSSGSFKGNLLNLTEPDFSSLFSTFIIDNKAFPSDWVESETAAACAVNCVHCGRCERILQRVLLKRG